MARLADSPTLLDRGWRVGLRVAYRILRVYLRVVQPQTTGVYVVVWSGGRILVVRHSYKDGVSVPSGRVRRGEPLSQAACRELREETGVVVAPAALRASESWVSRTEANPDRIHFFEVELPAEPEVRIDRREIVWASWRTPAEASEMTLWRPFEQFLERRGLR